MGHSPFRLRKASMGFIKKRKKPSTTPPPAPTTPPKPVKKPASTGEENGHFVQKLGDPIQAIKVKRGMPIVDRGAVCYAIRDAERIKVEGRTHMVSISVREHPTQPGGHTLIKDATETLYRKILSHERVD